MVFGCPKDTLDIVEKRKKELEKEKVKFLDEMKLQQEDFKEMSENIERTVMNFHQYQNLKNYEEVAIIAEDINKSLLLYIEESKKFNSREALFD